MIKKVFFSLLVFTVTELSFADDGLEARILQKSNAMLKSMGLPAPDGKVTVKPANQIPGYEQRKSNIESDEASVKKYGYIKKDDTEIHSLLNFGKEHGKLSPKNLTASADTGLYKSKSDIQMAYTYHGVPNSLMTKEIAFGPGGTYLDGKEPKGWTGAGQIFDTTNVGTCHYSEINAKLSQGSALIAQENATYEINGKITVKEIHGEDGKGFLYTVLWFEDDFHRTLKCANPDFSEEKILAVTHLATAIDNNSR